MVLLYSQPGCAQCRVIHTLLDKNNIDYTEIQEISEIEKKGIDHTPALEINGTILKGKEIFNWINKRK